MRPQKISCSETHFLELIFLNSLLSKTYSSYKWFNNLIIFIKQHFKTYMMVEWFSTRRVDPILEWISNFLRVDLNFDEATESNQNNCYYLGDNWMETKNRTWIWMIWLLTKREMNEEIKSKIMLKVQTWPHV